MEILTIPVTPFFVNCYVVTSGNETVVIDPGEATRDLSDTLSNKTVALIINTHGHCDHCGANATVMSTTHAPLAIHEDDLPLLRSLEVQGQMFGLQVESSPMPDRYLTDGEIIKVGSDELRVAHAPGHSPGHVVLIGDGFVFSGDVLFAGSIGRTDLPGGDYHRLMRTIKEVLLPLPDDTVVYPGHGPASTIGDERRHNPFLAQL